MTTRPPSDAIEPIAGQVPEWLNSDALRTWVRDRVSTSFHPSSACRMGSKADSMAVVDHAGRVHGVAGRRVVDASMFPTSPRANLHCTVVAIAEELADAIRFDQP